MPETLEVQRFDEHPRWVTNLVASRYEPPRGFDLATVRLVRRAPGP